MEIEFSDNSSFRLRVYVGRTIANVACMVELRVGFGIFNLIHVVADPNSDNGDQCLEQVLDKQQVTYCVMT